MNKLDNSEDRNKKKPHSILRKTRDFQYLTDARGEKSWRRVQPTPQIKPLFTSGSHLIINGCCHMLSNSRMSAWLSRKPVIWWLHLLGAQKSDPAGEGSRHRSPQN